MTLSKGQYIVGLFIILFVLKQCVFKKDTQVQDLEKQQYAEANAQALKEALAKNPQSLKVDSDANKSASNESAKNAVVERFKSKAEPLSKDATWTADKIFKVGVIDDGTSRNGYAQYVCSVLDDYGFKGDGIQVKVIDIVKLVNTNKWETLGQAQCP